ncbi:hypothetical protein FACS1894162_4350 [Bacteroidia bacterium]|nr:hypothetical protein FACS1894162_4350 [Bacteroidia bacterium]
MEYGSSSNGQRKVETYRTIELLKDGKAIDNGSVTTWEVSDKCLFIGNKVYNYEVSNSKLQLTDGSKTVSFIKMN